MIQFQDHVLSGLVCVFFLLPYLVSSSFLPALPPALFSDVEMTLRISTPSSHDPSPQGHALSPPQVSMELTLTWLYARSVRTKLGPEAAGISLGQ